MYMFMFALHKHPINNQINAHSTTTLGDTIGIAVIFCHRGRRGGYCSSSLRPGGHCRRDEAYPVFWSGIALWTRCKHEVWRRRRTVQWHTVRIDVTSIHTRILTQVLSNKITQSNPNTWQSRRRVEKTHWFRTKTTHTGRYTNNATRNHKHKYRHAWKPSHTYTAA